MSLIDNEYADYWHTLLGHEAIRLTDHGLVPHGGWSRITEFLAFSKSLLL